MCCVERIGITSSSSRVGSCSATMMTPNDAQVPSNAHLLHGSPQRRRSLLAQPCGYDHARRDARSRLHAFELRDNGVDEHTLKAADGGNGSF